MLYEVITAKFLVQIAHIAADGSGITQNAVLQERITKASVYFYDLIRNKVVQPLENVVFSTVITSYSIHYTKLYEKFQRLFPKAKSRILKLWAKSTSNKVEKHQHQNKLQKKLSKSR